MRKSGTRDAAIIAFLRAGGFRPAEICVLDLADHDAGDGTLIVRGNRNIERRAYITNVAADAMADWLAIRGNEPGALFSLVNKGGCVSIRCMRPEAIFFALRKRSDQAGVEDPSPHDFGRTFVSALLDAGADIVTVQHLAGHANVQTAR